MKKALLVIDVQNDFLPPDGSLAVPRGDHIVEPIVGLMNDKNAKWDCIVVTRDWHGEDHVSFAKNHDLSDFTKFEYESPVRDDGSTQVSTLWPVHCVKNTWGSELAPALQREVERGNRAVRVVDKGYLSDREYYSAFNDIWDDHKTELDGYLRAGGITDVYIVGVALEFCVKNTAISAARLGYRVTILQDYTKPIDGSDQAMDSLRQELDQHHISLR